MFTLSSVNKMIYIEKDLHNQTERANKYCNPRLYKEFPANCVIIWKDIENKIKQVKKMEKESFVVKTTRCSFDDTLFANVSDKSNNLDCSNIL